MIDFKRVAAVIQEIDRLQREDLDGCGARWRVLVDGREQSHSPLTLCRGWQLYELQVFGLREPRRGKVCLDKQVNDGKFYNYDNGDESIKRWEVIEVAEIVKPEWRTWEPSVERTTDEKLQTAQLAAANAIRQAGDYRVERDIARAEVERLRKMIDG